MEEENVKDIYYKQKKLFNPHKDFSKIHIYGAGSIGSHVAIGLAKIGIKNISIYDFDEVEEANVPAQFYSFNSTGKKVDEIAKIVKEFTKIEIECNDLKIGEDFKPDISLNSIHILALDNIETRKLLYNRLKDYPVWLIDGRIGGFNWEKYCLNLKNDSELYSKTLDGTFSEAECGEKCLWTVNSLIASKIIADVIKITNKKDGENVPCYMVKGNIMGEALIIKREQIKDGEKDALSM